MKIALYVLHYGCEYIAHSIRSIQNAVDEIHVLYSPTPTFGTKTGAVCPDTEETLFEQARRFCKKPLQWRKGFWANEGEHRDSIYPIAKEIGTKQILVVDSDELWLPGQAELALSRSQNQNGIVRARFCHFWRSFKWICLDPCMPVRVINLGSDGRPKPGEWYLTPQERPVLHFGYAISSALIRYKWQIHGHQAELKKNWLEEKFLNWNPSIRDVHPTCDNFWFPEAVKPEFREELKVVLGDHPYWDKELIS